MKAHVRLQFNNQRETCTCNQTTFDREDTEHLGRARLVVVDTNLGGLPSEALPEGPASAASCSSFIGDRKSVV